MASSINASLTAGLVQTADTSGIINLQSNGATVAQVSSTGVAVTGDLTTTGNTILGNASTDTLNVGNGDLVKDASGNVGIGVTPSAWGTLFPALQIGTGGSFLSAQGSTPAVYVGANAYYNAGWKYSTTNFATYYAQSGTSGTHIWYTAPSGTAGNPITFTQAMTLDASGNLGVGIVPGTNRLNVSYDGVRSSLYVNNAGNVGMYSLGTGTMTCSAGIVSYTSDARLKISDGVVENGLDKINSLTPRYYFWRVGETDVVDESRPRELGFFAQEINASLGEEAAPTPHADDVYFGIHDRAVMAVMVKAIQEQQAIITSLTARLEVLENK